jgi:long-chain acyl-CoA synthetase
VTYTSLLTNILKFGTALQELGIPERSHIAVVGENRVQWGITYLTCMCFNYVIAPIDRNLSINEVLNILHESDAVAVVYSDAFEPILSERRSSMALKTYINMDLTEEHEGSCPADRASGRARVARIPAEDRSRSNGGVIFTSGSLGRAKAVMLSQESPAIS